MLACFSFCITARSRRSSRATAGSKKRARTMREPKTPMKCEKSPMPQPNAGQRNQGPPPVIRLMNASSMMTPP
jgi:hypothetical protein